MTRCTVTVPPPPRQARQPRATRRRAIAWAVWLAVTCVSAAGLRHYRVANDLEAWVPQAAAVGVYKSYIVVGWERTACSPAVVAGRLGSLEEVALCIDPVGVGAFGPLAGITPEDFVLSRDGRYAGAFCFSRPGVADDRFVGAIRAALAADLRTAPAKFALGGPAVYHAALDRVSQHGLPQLMAAIPVVGLLLLWWVIGRFGHAFASVIAISLSQVTLLGIVGWLRVPADLSVSMVPPLMMCLGFSYATHRSLRRRNERALALCAITTAAGIGSFAFTPLAPVRHFALFGMAGLVLVWLAAATLLPAPLRRRRVWLPQLLAACFRVRRSGAGRTALFAAAAAITLAGFAGLPRLRLQTDALTLFPPGTAEIEDFRQLDRHLTGMLPFQVTLAREGGKADAPAAETADAIGLLRGTAGVRKVIDVTFGTRALGFPQDGDDRGARTYWCLAANDALPALAAAQPQWQAWAGAHDARLQWRGVAAQLVGAQDALTRTAASSLPCMVLLAAAATGYLGSGSPSARVRAALVGGWVSVLPVAGLAAVVATRGMPLGLPALMIGAITIGVAVDDTLHLTAALRRTGGRGPQAMTRAAMDCWRPSAGSSTVAACTLALFAISPFGPTRQFGLLMAAAILLAALANHLVAASFLVPAGACDKDRSAGMRSTKGVAAHDFADIG